MLGDQDSVFDRLWEKISEKFDFLVPLWIARRPESVTIFDYRPTFMMFLAAAGLVVLAVLFVLLLMNYDPSLWWVLGLIGLIAAAIAFFMFRCTIREVYYFDKTTGQYSFVRQFIHRREVIEGALSQFTGAYVKTERNDESESYFVVLKQEGMFLTGVSEQTLREEVPIFNTFSREARIASAISSILAAKR